MVCGLVRVSVGGHSGVWVSIAVCGGHSGVWVGMGVCGGGGS